MKLNTRLRKLEAKSQVGMWATFTTKNYEDPDERKKAKKRLLDEYLAAGNPQPIGCIYWNEIVPEMGTKDAFTGDYSTNPLAEIMDRIAANATDPLEHTQVV